MQKKQFVIQTPSLYIIYTIFALVAGLILPVILIPVIKLTDYSEFVEELAKALVVLFLILKIPNHKAQILTGVGFGLLFGVSENFLYLNQIFQLGDFSVFWQRFLLTVPMHISTVLVMVFAGIGRKWFLIFGFIGAVILHSLFNSLVANMLI